MTPDGCPTDAIIEEFSSLTALPWQVVLLRLASAIYCLTMLEVLALVIIRLIKLATDQAHGASGQS